MQLTLATYNIHACVGGDGRFQPSRTVEVLKEINADLVALQEVEHHDVGGSNLLDYLADALNMEAIAGPTLMRGTRHYGNALLTRMPVISVERIDLSVPRREPRGALDVELSWGHRRVQVVATHLGLRPRERRPQVRRLLACFESRRVDVAVLMGDLNEWLLWGRPLRWLRRHFDGIRQSPATYPARFPLLALDRIWVNPAAALVHVAHHRTDRARQASDHLPLKASLTDELFTDFPEAPRLTPDQSAGPAVASSSTTVLGKPPACATVLSGGEIRPMRPGNRVMIAA
jgi:endonuclease/exonuclease/phosphatase family metal-dependent hydrolase